MTQPDFIIIPTQLLSDENLQPSDRILFGYIYWMTKLALMKCVASNQTLSELTAISERGIQQSLVRLEEQGYVRRIYAGSGNTHRSEIECLVAFSAPMVDTARTNVRASTNKRSSPARTNVHHNKKREIEDLNKSTNVLVDSAKPNATEPDIQKKLKAFFYMLVAALGFSETVRYTDGRKRKLQSRLKSYKGKEILKAAENLGADDYMQGDNPTGKRYGDIDYLLRNDEIIDKYLNKTELSLSEGAF